MTEQDANHQQTNKQKTTSTINKINVRPILGLAGDVNRLTIARPSLSPLSVGDQQT